MRKYVSFILMILLPSCTSIALSTNVDTSGVAIEGYDPVAYFLQGEAIRGDDDFAFPHEEAIYHFSSYGNLERFRKNPQQYLPQYGGYCAWAVKEGYIAKINPKAWTISNERLFLNYSKSYQRRFEKDLQSNIEQADNNWLDLKKTLSSELSQ